MIETGFAVAASARASVEARQFERLLTSISSRFIDLPSGRIDEAITEGLREIVETLGLDRSTLSNVDPSTGQFHSTHSWAAPGFTPVPRTVSSRTYPWATSLFRAGQPLVFSRLDELPPEAALDAASYASIGLRSHVGVPVIVSGEFMAVLGFGAMRDERAWPAELVARMRLLGDIFGSALARKRAQDRIDALLRFERLLADVSASLVRSPGFGLDVEVHGALGAVGAVLDVDCCALWKLGPDSANLVITHRWVAEGAPLHRQPLDAAAAPWITKEIVAGGTVKVASLDHLPPAATTDSTALRTAGVRSVLAVPLRTNDAVTGALVLACAQGERVWQDDVEPRLQLFGKLLVDALAIRDAEEGAQRAALEAAQLRERLAHLARVDAVGVMSVAVAHEVNQPLMAIENYALAGRRRIGGGAVDHAKLDELLEKIGSQAALASQVLDGLRAMVRRREPEEVEIDLSRLLRNCLGLIEMEGRTKAIRIEMAIAPDLPRLLGDPIQIQQVVLNLAHNAMDAMSATPAREKALRFEAAACAGGGTLVRVADRGPGLAGGDEEKVFEPFFTTKATGLGVGLAISRAIVEAHGGRLWHVPNPGGGAVFQFTLPEAKDGA